MIRYIKDENAPEAAAWSASPTPKKYGFQDLLRPKVKAPASKTSEMAESPPPSPPPKDLKFVLLSSMLLKSKPNLSARAVTESERNLWMNWRKYEKQSRTSLSRARRGPRTTGGRLSVGSSVGQGDMLKAVRSARTETSSRPRRVIFGETDYLRDKLGFCMPPVKQTLACESWKAASEGEQSLGFQYTSKQRFNIIQQLFLERAVPNPQQQTNRTSITKSNAVKSSGSDKKVQTKKGNLASKQYIIRLDANTRREKHMDERAKFALSREIFRQETKKVLLDQANATDLEVVEAARSMLHLRKHNDHEKS